MIKQSVPVFLTDTTLAADDYSAVENYEVCACICTWHITPLVSQALNHLWDVLLVAGLGQSEDDLHDVPVH